MTVPSQGPSGLSTAARPHHSAGGRGGTVALCVGVRAGEGVDPLRGVLWGTVPLGAGDGGTGDGWGMSGCDGWRGRGGGWRTQT